jgi:hypothetical protein
LTTTALEDEGHEVALANSSARGAHQRVTSSTLQELKQLKYQLDTLLLVERLLTRKYCEEWKQQTSAVLSFFCLYLLYLLVCAFINLKVVRIIFPAD